jgi:hypothetical protein
MSRFGPNKIIATPEDVAHLAERLSRCSEVTRYDAGEHKEAWALAGSFADLEGSFRVLLDEQLPKLAQGNLPPSEMYDLLLDIGEEFRHILYHILEQQKFYRYLVPEDTEISGQPRQHS